MIVIVDLGMGNLHSVAYRLKRLGVEVVTTSDAQTIYSATKLVLPGVGHFAFGMQKINELGLTPVLYDCVIEHNVPILGICLGMQLMAAHSEEGDIAGLGWFDANVLRFNIIDKIRYKVPHMGWNNIELRKESVLNHGILPDASFYFVHSYHIVCRNEMDILANTTYSYTFTSAIQRNNIYGVQFHPEKSHDWGEILMRNFIERT